MVQSAAGLAVTVDEHGVGWGQQDCALCHPSWNLHAHSCSESTIDMTRIDEHASLSEPETCTDCHGDNGVPEWEETDTGAE